MVHGGGSGMSRDLPVAAPCSDKTRKFPFTLRTASSIRLLYSPPRTPFESSRSVFLDDSNGVRRTDEEVNRQVLLGEFSRY